MTSVQYNSRFFGAVAVILGSLILMVVLMTGAKARGAEIAPSPHAADAKCVNCTCEDNCQCKPGLRCPVLHLSADATAELFVDGREKFTDFGFTPDNTPVFVRTPAGETVPLPAGAKFRVNGKSVTNDELREWAATTVDTYYIWSAEAIGNKVSVTVDFQGTTKVARSVTVATPTTIRLTPTPAWPAIQGGCPNGQCPNVRR